MCLVVPWGQRGVNLRKNYVLWAIYFSLLFIEIR